MNENKKNKNIITWKIDSSHQFSAVRDCFSTAIVVNNDFSEAAHIILATIIHLIDFWYVEIERTNEKQNPMNW